MDPSHTQANPCPDLAGRAPLRFLVGVVLVSVCASAAIFLLYALVERRWLADLPPELRDTAHLVRGLMASFVAALSTAVYLLGFAIPSLERSLERQAPATDQAGVAVQEALAVWFVELRWVAVLASFTVVTGATLATERVAPVSVVPLFAGVGGLFFCNLFFSLLGARRLATRPVLLAQVALDVGVLGWLVHHAGGVSNPFAGFFVFHAVLAAIVLDARSARRTALGISAWVLALTAVEASDLLPPGCLGNAEGQCAQKVDWAVHAAAGTTISAIVVGCAFIVVTLGRFLWAERDRLARTSATLAAHADALGASQAQLGRERERLQAIVDCMADAVLYVTPEGAIGLHNAAARQLWSGEAQAKLDVRSCHSPGKWEQLFPAFARPDPLKAHPLFEADGRSWEATYARVHDKEGAYQGVVMAARDVTERIEAQRWRMQEERMAVVGKLAAGLAHEINNPLGAIALFTQHALADMPPSHPLADHLGTVLRNTLHCKRIVRDLLQYARQRPPERRDVPVRDLLGDVARTLEAHASASGVKMRTVHALAEIVYGDADQLRQVLVNLGLNAIEAMPGGGSLTFEARPARGGGVELRVEDQGPGIAPEDLERVFSAFHTTKPDGTGLGLTVVRDLVDAHGGTIEVESRPGEGAAFIVVLPCRPEIRAPEHAT